MKAKIFAKLKQEYSYLGLGDEVLMSRADSLNKTGLITDDNLAAVVAVQKSDLEALQKRMDARVTDALEKDRKARDEEAKRKKKEEEEAEKKRLEAEAIEAYRKAEEERKRKEEEEARRKVQGGDEPKPEPKPEPTPTPAPTPAPEPKPEQTPEPKSAPQNDPRIDKLEQMIAGLSEQMKSQATAYEDNIKKLTDSRDSLAAQVKSLTDENERVKAEQKLAAHRELILSKAKELGVPDWRIEEGFNIADDADEEAIVGVLSKVANNIRTNTLPGSRSFVPQGLDEPTKEDISELASKLISK